MAFIVIYEFINICEVTFISNNFYMTRYYATAYTEKKNNILVFQFIYIQNICLYVLMPMCYDNVVFFSAKIMVRKETAKNVMSVLIAILFWIKIKQIE